MHQDREQALSFVAVISELTASIQRLKASHSLAEALTIVIALVLSVFGADATQERRSNGSSLPSAASKKPLSRSAKRRNRLDPEHRAALDAKRAEYLSAKSQRRAQESATAAAAAAQARVDSVVEPKSSKSPLPPPPHTSPTGLDPSLASTQHAAPAILERVHGAQDARSPIGTFESQHSHHCMRRELLLLDHLCHPTFTAPTPSRHRLLRLLNSSPLYPAHAPPFTPPLWRTRDGSYCTERV